MVQVDSERKRFSLTLKPSIVASGATDASYLRTLFSDLEAAEAIRTSQEDGGSGAIDWNNALAIGSVVKGSVHKIEEYGVLVDLDAHQVGPSVCQVDLTPSLKTAQDLVGILRHPPPSQRHRISSGSSVTTGKKERLCPTLNPPPLQRNPRSPPPPPPRLLPIPRAPPPVILSPVPRWSRGCWTSQSARGSST